MNPLPPLPHQIEARDALAANHRFGLFDEPGVGKTASTIFALDKIGAKKVLIVAPAAVREVWVGELKKFSATPRRVLKGRSVHDLGAWMQNRADVLVTSYEMAAKWSKHIDDLYDAIVLDESHYLKSPDSQRTRHILGSQCDGKKSSAQYAAHAWFLTGTPATNGPTDVWTFLRFSGATKLTYNQFLGKYFTGFQTAYGGRFKLRPECVEELRALMGRYSIRRTKKDIGLKLPPIWLTTQTVDGDTEEIKSLLRGYPGLEGAIIDALDQGGLSFIDAQHIATLRRLVGEAKAPAFAELLCEELQNGLDKAVVMGIHTRALDVVRVALAAKGIKAVGISGATSEAERVKAVEAFNNDPETRVFVGNIRAAGTGLTLTAAADIIMLESSWSPADNAQALMRVHRIGQTRNVRARFISLANSIDEVVSATVARKTAAIAELGVEMVAGA